MENCFFCKLREGKVAGKAKEPNKYILENDLNKEHVGKWKCSYCKKTNMCTRCVYPRPGSPMCYSCQAEIFK